MDSILEKISSIEDIKAGHLPSYFFPKLMELDQLKIEPLSRNSLGNICYYLHFNNLYRKFNNNEEAIDLNSKNSIEDAFDSYEECDELVLNPGESVIAQTFEKIGISNWLLAKLENTSALGRVFLNHASHGYSHPGHGIDEPIRIMLELTNPGKKKINIQSAKIVDGQVIGTEAMRMYVEKLPYPTDEYKSTASVHKLKMNNLDLS